MAKKYSSNFERDYSFYLLNKDIFNFCGTLIPKQSAISDENGKTAKEVFYSIDSQGKNIPCKEPELLNELLLCKGGVNFQIKLWAEGRADGTLPSIEFEEIMTEFSCPDWVWDAVERQKEKLYKQKGIYDYFENKVISVDSPIKHSENYIFF